MTVEKVNEEDQPQGLRGWIINHDDSWLFLGLYIGLAVVLSIWISLFWLVAVVAVHFLFEWVRQTHLTKHRRTAFLQVLWELKLDIGLVIFALVLSLYMEVVLGLVGLQGATRAGAAVQAGAKGGARFAVWEQILRGVLLTVDDVAQVARAVLSGRKKAQAKENGKTALTPTAVGEVASEIISSSAKAGEEESLWGDWLKPWGKGDWIAVVLLISCVGLLLAAPLLTDHTWHTIFLTLADELHPYPTDEL